MTRQYAQLNARVIEDIKQLDVQLKSMSTIVASLERKKDTPQLHSALHEATERTKTLSHDASAAIRRMSGLPCADAQLAARRLANQKLGGELKARLESFQKVQERARACDKLALSSAQKAATFVPATGSTHSSIADPDSERMSLLDREREQKFSVAQAELEFNEQIIAERERGIQEIEGTLVEVNEIFRDLATIVAEQGDMLNVVESNVESTVANTGKGYVHAAL